VLQCGHVLFEATIKFECPCVRCRSLTVEVEKTSVLLRKVGIHLSKFLRSPSQAYSTFIRTNRSIRTRCWMKPNHLPHFPERDEVSSTSVAGHRISVRTFARI